MNGSIIAGRWAGLPKAESFPASLQVARALAPSASKLHVDLIMAALACAKRGSASGRAAARCTIATDCGRHPDVVRSYESLTGSEARPRHPGRSPAFAAALHGLD